MRMARARRVLFAAGGSGGHVFPAIAVAEELRRTTPDVDIAFVGTAHRLEAQLVPDAGFRFIPVHSAGIPRRPSLRLFPALAKIGWGVAQCSLLVARERPSVVFGTGGFASAPLIAAAATLRVPSLIHDSNAVPGLANTWLGKVATEVHIAFEPARASFAPSKVRLTGNPLRRAILSARDARAGRVRDADAPMLAVLGGSQGARSLNDAVVSSARKIVDSGVRILHQTGADDHARVIAAYEERLGRDSVSEDIAEWGGKGRNASVVPFVNEMEAVYSGADLVLCRAGAMTISELTYCGTPSILAPLPHARTDEQRLNARGIAEAGAAVVIEQADLTERAVRDTVIPLLHDGERLGAMERACATVALPNATEDLVAAIVAHL
jgi:UDP-N-acetylglucosamine--N-acetylmuramyl-(pentapeptide) pyrophosphoryl-undecaprenol N-acetylglucosamine transferase